MARSAITISFDLFQFENPRFRFVGLPFGLDAGTDGRRLRVAHTVETEIGFAELLRGWLERANANREERPKPTEPIAPETSASPSTDDVAPTLDLEDFRNRVFRLYDDALAANGMRRMNTLEMGRFKMAADQLKIGQVQSIGLERGETWAIADVLRLLGLSKREAA